MSLQRVLLLKPTPPPLQNPLFVVISSVQKDTVIVKPATYFEEINSPEADKWLEAMKDEMQSLSALENWSYVEKSQGEQKKALPVKWVYKIKRMKLGISKGLKQG
jgi:hypothetical protein